MLPWSSQPPWTECCLSCPMHLHWTLINNKTEISTPEAHNFQAILLPWSIIIFLLLSCMWFNIFLWVRILLILETWTPLLFLDCGRTWSAFLSICCILRTINNFFIFLASSSILLFVAQNNVHDLYLKCTTHVSTRQLWVSTQQWIDSLKVILLVEIGNLKTRNIIKIENLCKGNILPK